MPLSETYYEHLTCSACRQGEGLPFSFSMAFQPIVNIHDQSIFAYEALARGGKGESAAVVFQQVNEVNLYRFDQSCRVKAIQLAAQLKIDCLLSINFMPNAVYQPATCIRTTLEAAHEFGFPTDRIMFEITEGEKVRDIGHLQEIIRYYQQRGFRTAIDDFGAGYAGLRLLADLQTDLIKLDMDLVRDIHTSHSRRAIVKGVLQVCKDLGISVIAEGVESAEELKVLRDLGVVLFQGYYFAKPAFESLPLVDFAVVLPELKNPA